jgi:small-conductance mechanosensitive channel
MSIREEINLEIMKIVQDNKASFAFPTQTIQLQSDNRI